MGHLGFAKLLYKSDAATRNRVVRRHIKACRASSCWDDIFLLQNFFWDCHVQHGDEPYNLYGDCFLPNALIRMANRETVKVKDLDYLGQPRVLSMGTTVRLTPGTIHISEAACKVNSYCNFKNATVRIVHLSGGRPPLVLGNEAAIGVYERAQPSRPGLTYKDWGRGLRKGQEVSVLNSNLVCCYHSFSAVELLGFLFIILDRKS